MRAQDAVAFSDIAASTAAFPLVGGRYGFDYIAGSWGTGGVTLEREAGDGTFVAVASAVTANGYSSLLLPPGTYKLVLPASGGPTGVYASVARVPME